MERSIIIITHYGTGGSLLYLKCIIGAFKSRGFPVTIYLPCNTDINVGEGLLCRRVLKEPSAINPNFSRPKLLKYLYHLSGYFYNAMAINPEGHVRVAHLLFPFYLTDLMMINRLRKRGIKVILSVHEVFPHKPFLGGRLDKKIIKKMYEKADLLIVHTGGLGRELMDLYNITPRKVRVIPHGYFKFQESRADIVALKDKYNVPHNKKILLFFGTVRKNKGLSFLLKAMKTLKDDHFLIIAGRIAGASEPGAEYYKMIIKTENINDSVCWIERYISDEEVSEIFRIADAVVLPYLRSFHAQSGPLNLAIGYERPCVASDVGGIGETVKKYNLGVVVKPEDIENLKQGIVELFNNRKEFGFNRCKNEMNWENVSNNLIMLYKELSEQKDDPPSEAVTSSGREE